MNLQKNIIRILEIDNIFKLEKALKLCNLFFSILDELLLEMEAIGNKRRLQKNIFQTGISSGINSTLFLLREKIEAIKNEEVKI
jgi:hypothetical protein